MTHVLGINAYHGDSSACLIKDGKLVSAAEEGRFRRVKHWAGFPSEVIRYCPCKVSAGLEQVGNMVINSNPKVNLRLVMGCLWASWR